MKLVWSLETTSKSYFDTVAAKFYSIIFLINFRLDLVDCLTSDLVTDFVFRSARSTRTQEVRSNRVDLGDGGRLDSKADSGDIAARWSNRDKHRTRIASRHTKREILIPGRRWSNLRNRSCAQRALKGLQFREILIPGRRWRQGSIRLQRDSDFGFECYAKVEQPVNHIELQYVLKLIGERQFSVDFCDGYCVVFKVLLEGKSHYQTVILNRPLISTLSMSLCS